MTPLEEDERAIVEQLLLSALVKSSHNGENPENIADSLACLARRKDRDATRDMAIVMARVVDEELEKIKYLQRELSGILKK